MSTFTEQLFLCCLFHRCVISTGESPIMPAPSCNNSSSNHQAVTANQIFSVSPDRSLPPGGARIAPRSTSPSTAVARASAADASLALLTTTERDRRTVHDVVEESVVMVMRPPRQHKIRRSVITVLSCRLWSKVQQRQLRNRVTIITMSNDKGSIQTGIDGINSNWTVKILLLHHHHQMRKEDKRRPLVVVVVQS